MVPTKREMYRQLAREIKAERFVHLDVPDIVRFLQQNAPRQAFDFLSGRVYFHGGTRFVNRTVEAEVFRLAMYLGRLARIMRRRPLKKGE